MEKILYLDELDDSEKKEYKELCVEYARLHVIVTGESEYGDRPTLRRPSGRGNLFNAILEVVGLKQFPIKEYLATGSKIDDFAKRMKSKYACDKHQLPKPHIEFGFREK